MQYCEQGGLNQTPSLFCVFDCSDFNPLLQTFCALLPHLLQSPSLRQTASFVLTLHLCQSKDLNASPSFFYLFSTMKFCLLSFVSNQSYLNKSHLFQKRSLMHHKTNRNIVLKALNNMTVHRLYMAVLLYITPHITFCITCICMEITHFRTLIT